MEVALPAHDRAAPGASARRPAWLQRDGALHQVRQIQDAVCDIYGCRRLDLLSARRGPEIVAPRHVAMFLCRATTALSLPAIGRQFGGRDHTAVLYALRKIEAAMLADAEFAAFLFRLRDCLRRAFAASRDMTGR